MRDKIVADDAKIKAINGNTFLKREAQEQKFGAIDISDKAQVKSHRAFVANGEKFLGEMVHVPHYGVTDMDICGEERAVCKEERLFAVYRDGWKPVNGYVKVRKCENDHIRDESGEIALYMTDNHIEGTEWVEVIDVADDCKKVGREYIGLFCVSPESDERLARIEYTKDYCLHEDLIEFLTDGG